MVSDVLQRSSRDNDDKMEEKSCDEPNCHFVFSYSESRMMNSLPADVFILTLSGDIHAMHVHSSCKPQDSS